MPEALQSFEHIFLIATKYEHDEFKICQQVHVHEEQYHIYFPTEDASVEELEASSTSSAFYQVATKFLSQQTSYTENRKSYPFDCKLGASGDHMILTVTDVVEWPEVLSRMSVIKTMYPPADAGQIRYIAQHRSYAADSVIAVAQATLVTVENWSPKILKEINGHGETLFHSLKHKTFLEFVNAEFSLDGSHFKLNHIHRDTEHHVFSVHNTESVLRTFFEPKNHHDHCIISVDKLYVTIFERNGIFYLYDTQGLGELGLNFKVDLDSDRYAELIILKNMEDLSEVLVRNLGNVPIGAKLSQFENDEKGEKFEIYYISFADESEKKKFTPEDANRETPPLKKKSSLEKSKLTSKVIESHVKTSKPKMKISNVEGPRYAKIESPNGLGGELTSQPSKKLNVKRMTTTSETEKTSITDKFLDFLCCGRAD